MNGTIRVGIGGWTFEPWRGVFYPQDLPESRWLSHYTRHFPTVELNNTHYILPSEKTFESWRDNSPEVSTRTGMFCTSLSLLFKR